MLSYPNSDILLNAFAVASSASLLYFFTMRFLIEPGLRRFYGERFTSMSWPDQRSFSLHFLWSAVKLSCIIPGLLALNNVVFHGQPLPAPIAPNSQLSNGDILSILYMMIMAMFVFELTRSCGCNAR